MKKTLAILLVLCLFIGLCACGKKDSAQTEYPENWDRIAEATATLNQYYACETEEEFKAVMHSSISDSDLKMVMDAWLGFRETWSMDTVGISEQYVRKIKYIESYKGYDVFMVADGFVSKTGERTPDDPLPTPNAPDLNGQLYMATPVVSTGHLLALAFENGRYVIANISDNDWQKYCAKFSVCTCDLGVVVIPGDPCKSCGGAGFMTEQPSTDVENEENDICATCGGEGQVSVGDGLIMNVNPCPDCSENLWIGSPIIGSGSALPTPCSDCEGTGLENYTLGACPDCSGQGYKKIG